MLQEGRQQRRCDDVLRDHRLAKGSGRACGGRGKLGFGSEKCHGDEDRRHRRGRRLRKSVVGGRLHGRMKWIGDWRAVRVEIWRGLRGCEVGESMGMRRMGIGRRD